ncbi:agmatinase [Candidatus Sulfidibacterium hydrothermale]|uniref:agmatinase n=1 Tax=Candidatus Sulfidibacterium hydrothermale TaxID=2875962 RepID=UPI001F0A1665|nr:agmatinase [Candidatus Sulfidibacterium hydrothermale]UBM62127.1 agmatinase [Candidatus Sulfidibacterium hydrothermale]
MRTFAGIEAKYAQKETAAVWLQSIPYDGTSTWGKGADQAFPAFLEAAENMEIYDIETDSEVYRNGIHILPEITENRSPEKVFETVYHTTKQLLESNRFLTFFGGEHSISIGIIRAFYEKYPDLSVLHLDAHTDLRPEYLGTPYNHACALHDASLHTNLVQVGIRSMDTVEKPFLNREQCWFAEEIAGRNDWMEKALQQLTGPVYITLDLDVFDPSVMPSTGTPEPGGLDWITVIRFLKKVFQHKQVVGFDMVELAPIPQLKGPDFLAAKLYYKMLSYQFKYHGK